MEIVTSGCTLPIDLVIGNTCFFGSIGGSLLLTLVVGLAFLLLGGIFNFGKRATVSAFQSTEKNDQDYAVDQVGRTIRVLIAIAAADGRLDDNEVKVIQYVGVKYLGCEFSEELIRTTYVKIGSDIDVEAEINGNLGGLSLKDENAITALIQGMFTVAACDGDVSAEEVRLLRRISAALGVNDEDAINARISRAREDAIEWQAAAQAHQA